MNKKFLSAILFGALMVTSTGTFVSCKDYDDDIDRIDKELTDLKSQLAALQTKVDGGKYVTNVTKNGDGIVVTWNDNSTSTIETIKGDKGDAVEITIDPTTKNWLIDGEDTGVCAEGKDGEAANGVSAKSPSIDPETGNWVVYAWDAEKQEYVGTDTGVSARGANAYVVEDSNYYILHVATSETGAEYTEVKLPKSPVVITEIETLGFVYTSAEKKLITGTDPTTDYDFYPVAYSTNAANVKYNFSLVGELTQEQKDWNAEEVTKKLTKGQALSTISSGSANIVVRIAPATVDASALSFSLINSQLAEAPIVLGTPVSYKGLLTEAGPDTRAVSGNGLWTMKVSAKDGLVYDTEDQYENQFSVLDEKFSERRSMLFAFKEKDGFVTNYELAFVRDNTMSLTAKPKNCNSWVGYQSSIGFNYPYNVYDAHLHFEQADVIRWGIEYSGNGTAFTITKMNDEQTVPDIPVEVHYVTLDGNVHKESVNIYVNKDYPETVLAGHNILINADADKNKFEESLDKMFNDLGDDNTTLWRHDVEVAYWNIYRVKNATEAYDIDVTNLYPGINVTFDKTGEELGKASKIIVSVGDETVDRTRSYYAEVYFCASQDQGNGRVLSMIRVPFTVSIPALTDLLVKEQVVFGGTANGTGVLNEYDWKAYEDASYSLKYAFNKLEDAYAGNTQINFAIDADQKIKINDEDVVVAGNLATVTAANDASVYVTLKDYEELKTPAYNTAINMVVTSASYLNRYEYTQEELNAAAFTLKIVSPIEQGTLTPAAGADATISVVATEEDGSAKVTESDLIAKTYAGVTYKIFENVFAEGATTAEGWASPYINDVPVFESTNENVFKMGEAQPATKDADGNVIPGYVIVKPMNVAYEDAVPVKVTVTDVWGYAKEATIKVKVSPKK